jgi:IS1 family transposase
VNRTADPVRLAVLRALIDGASVRAAARMAGSSKGAVLRLLAEVGEFCAVYQYYRLRDLPTTRIEADEIWSFCGAKARNAKLPTQGDLWTFCALDADTKLVLSWLVGARTSENTNAFMSDVASRLRNRVQLTTDGFGAYLTAVRRAFAFGRVDFAQLIKEYGQGPEEPAAPARKYSPPICIGTTKIRMIGRPDPDLVSTSYVERLNLDTRQRCRRFTRLTNAHSKKAENHAHAVALNFFTHNFCRPHSTLTKAAGVPTTPAMAAGLTNRVWTVADMLAMMNPATARVG